MRQRFSFLALPFLVCCGGSSPDHPDSHEDAAVAHDARVDASGAHDAGQGNDASVDDGSDAASDDSDAGPCAGPSDGTWQDTSNALKLTLGDDCTFSYSARTCTASGTYTPIDSATGTGTVHVSATTGDTSSDAGLPYPCFDMGNHVCIFQPDNDTLTYYCMGTAVSAPGMLTR